MLLTGSKLWVQPAHLNGTLVGSHRGLAQAHSCFPSWQRIWHRLGWNAIIFEFFHFKPLCFPIMTFHRPEMVCVVCCSYQYPSMETIAEMIPAVLQFFKSVFILTYCMYKKLRLFYSLVVSAVMLLLHVCFLKINVNHIVHIHYE